jgi:hypothetical protein
MVDEYSGMELCTPTWLNHDYVDGGNCGYIGGGRNSGVELCTTIFLGEASK